MQLPAVPSGCSPLLWSCPGGKAQQPQACVTRDLGGRGKGGQDPELQRCVGWRWGAAGGACAHTHTYACAKTHTCTCRDTYAHSDLQTCIIMHAHMHSCTWTLTCTLVHTPMHTYVHTPPPHSLMHICVGLIHTLGYQEAASAMLCVVLQERLTHTNAHMNALSNTHECTHAHACTQTGIHTCTGMHMCTHITNAPVHPYAHTHTSTQVQMHS